MIAAHVVEDVEVEALRVLTAGGHNLGDAFDRQIQRRGDAFGIGPGLAIWAQTSALEMSVVKFLH